MTPKVRTILAAVTLLMGLILMVGGIVTGKHGATVVGMCVAAVAAQQLTFARKQSRTSDKV